MAFSAIDRLIHRDPERRALRALADRTKHLEGRRRPDASLQIVVDLARELTNGRYAALAMPIVPLEGGEPIITDGVVIGAIGVSGVKAGEDAQVARAGITRLLNAREAA